MNSNRLITIDNLFKPLYGLLKWFKTIFPSKAADSDGFVVMKFFGLGSISRMLYVIQQLDIPTEKVVFITLKRNREIIEILQINAMYIDASSASRLITSAFTCIGLIWKKRNVQILDMERSSNLAGIFRIIISIRKSCSSFILAGENRKIGNQLFVSLVDKPITTAIAEMFGRKFVAKEEPKKLKIQIDTHEILVNINAGEYLPQRKFPKEQYAQLIENLHHHNPSWKFVLTGAKSEIERVRAFEKILIQNKIPNANILNLAGKQTLRELIDSIKTSQLFITNDSGPLHLANYYGVKTVCLWGPTSAKLVGYPNSNRMLNLVSDEKCYPCFLHPKSKVAVYCHGNLTCFKSMNTEKLVNKIVDFAEGKENKELYLSKPSV